MDARIFIVPDSFFGPSGLSFAHGFLIIVSVTKSKFYSLFTFIKFGIEINAYINCYVLVLSHKNTIGILLCSCVTVAFCPCDWCPSHKNAPIAPKHLLYFAIWATSPFVRHGQHCMNTDSQQGTINLQHLNLSKMT